MRIRTGIALALVIALFTPLAFSMESERYLGNKLHYVLERVDNAYIEKNKTRLVQRHRKAFSELNEFLIKKYPDLEVDLNAWLETNYGEDIDRTLLDEKHGGFTLEALLALDRQEPLFRRRCIAYITEKYPRLFGETACFLRDHYPSALQEVLRMTLRMTSHVKPCAYISREDTGPEIKGPEGGQGLPSEGNP
jgi:hypothetical protein